MAPRYIEYSDPIPANVFVGKPDSIKTKGYGAIDASGDMTLAGKNIHVYAFSKKDGTDFSVTAAENSASCLVDATLNDGGGTGGLTAHITNINACAEWLGSIPMFTSQDMIDVPFDFFAYYIDTLNLDRNQIHRMADKVVLDVSLDGRTDVMTARSEYSGEDADEVFPYSYCSAAMGIFPIFKFQHKLVKFTFSAIPGFTTSGATKSITIQNVILMAAKKAQMTVAYKGELTTSDFVADESSIGELALTEVDGETFKRDHYHFLVTGEVHRTDTLQLGGAMLVPPSDSYQAIVETSEITEYGEEVVAFNKVDLVFEDGFMANSSYHISLKLFGNMVVGATVQMEPWESGGEIFVPDYTKPE